MTEAPPAPPTFWRTVAILLGAARRRADGRRRRQRELFRQRTGREGSGGGWGLLVTIVFALAINGSAVFVVKQGVDEARRVEPRGGDPYAAFARRDAERVSKAIEAGHSLHQAMRDSTVALRREAERLAKRNGSDVALEHRRLVAALEHRKLSAAMSREVPAQQVDAGLAKLGWQGLPAMLGSLVLLAWSAMLVFSGEGLELDVQRVLPARDAGADRRQPGLLVRAGRPGLPLRLRL